MATKGPRFALVIGINQYESPKIPTLKGAVSDADEVQKFLEQDLNVPTSRIRNLRDQEATRATIIKAFRDLQNDPNIEPGDPILIFFAGHGGEAEAPKGWEAGDTVARTQMLLPYDFGTTVDSRFVQGIPDRTIGALLHDLAEEKGDNVTVILDCGHSGLGTLTNRNDPTRVSRAAEVPNNVPADLDQDIWHDTSVAPGFLRGGLKSHVLVAACSAGEEAHESNERGIFTKAFLEKVRSVGVDKLTYNQITQQLQGLDRQNPRCEGINQDRRLFTSTSSKPGSVSHMECFRIAMEGSLVGLFEALALKRFEIPQRRIALVKRDMADLEIGADDDRVVFNILDPRVSQHGLTRMPFSVPRNVDDIHRVIQAAAHYRWQLHRSTESGSLHNKVHIEFRKVEACASDKSGVTSGPNLNNNGVVTVFDDSIYAVEVVNTSDMVLYPGVCVFDNSDLSIISYPPLRRGVPFKVDAPLPPNESVTLSCGSGLCQFHYALRDGQDVDIGFLKLFVATQPTDLSNVLQSSPFESHGSSPKIETAESNTPVQTWDSLLITVVQRRAGST